MEQPEASVAGALRQARGRQVWAGWLVGFSLGGFFDGILLHQILQWHHLLSLVDGVGDLGAQVMFDGLFHLLMYGIGAVGLFLLFRARKSLHQPGSGRRLVWAGLLGFGIWHIVDAVLSHWLLGIHRIKLDSDNPLAWDVAWLVLFGLVPLALGLLLRRGDAGGPHGRGSGGRLAAGALALAVALAAPLAALPSPNDGSAVVVFRPGMSEGDIMRAIVSSGGALLWEKRGIWAVQWEDGGGAGSLYGQGALMVSNGLVAAGCLGWARLS